MYQLDSRKIQSGDYFICLPGAEKYVAEALQKGALDVLYMTREQMANWSCEYFGEPSKQLIVIGVTGTNGKTTVTQWVGKALEAAGYKPYVLGTLNASLTTPEALDIQRLMREHLDNGGTHFVMEVSSHAIHQGRILGIQFAVRLLTNITQDHLDYHKTFEAYSAVKMSFMAQGGDRAIYPKNYESIQIPFDMPVPGEFNRRNMQAVLAVLQALKVSEKSAIEALSKIKAPSGRFEAVDQGQPFWVIVDYAHTPDGLDNVLKEARQVANKNMGRVITVFGCGGDRDRTKRPLMAKVAEQYSDLVLVTSDNPRTESQDQIFQDILKGFSMEPAGIYSDRKEAIHKAIGLASVGDVVMIAGKGHETYQLVAGQTLYFDDREEAREALSRKGYV